MYPVAVVAGVSLGALSANPATTTGASSAAPTVTVTATPSSSETPETFEESQRRLASEAARAATEAPTATAKPTKPTTQPPAKPTKPAAPAYRKITTREWKLIAKDPDAYAGERLVVYGVVTQFDSATGTDGFRADVDSRKHADAYEYDTNTVLTGDSARLAELVKDDMFSARVTVVGSYSYDTQIGGNTTVPQLQVDGITVLT
jgi:hypothetical protein